MLFLLFPMITLAVYPPPTPMAHFGVVSAQPLASKVGLNILQAGGNAVDAAVAMGYALAVVYPCCGNLGGGGFMLIHLNNGINTVIDFRETAPSAITPQLFLNKQGQLQAKLTQKSYLSVGVPGTVMGLNTALHKYGSLPLNRVIKPAITLAEQGFILNQADIKLLQQNTDDFKRQANVAAIFLNHGQAFHPGDRLIQLQLANTLKLISQQGSQIFYHGSIADSIIAASKMHRGVLQKKDFTAYHALEKPVLHCSYHGYQIITVPPPSSGVTVCEILKIVDSYPLATWGYHSAQTIRHNVEAMRYAFIDRNQRLGDPDFVTNPIDELLSDKHIELIRKQIQSSQPNTKVTSPQPNLEGAHTTHYAVVDAAGNAVAVTYTINSFFGSGFIANDTGFFLNNDLDDFTISVDTKNMFGLLQGQANMIKPGKRPLSSMSPTMIFKDNKLVMIIGAAGGPTIVTTIVEIIENVFDFGMDINTAINEPRYHFQGIPQLIYLEPYTISFDTAQILKNAGYHLHWGSIFNTPYWGQANAIIAGNKPIQYFGATDYRRGGLALGAGF